MEQRSTKGSSNGVPGQVKKTVSDKDLLASFGLEFPDFETFTEMKMPEFPDFSSDLQKRADEMMAKVQQESERMLAESRRWLEEGRLLRPEDGVRCLLQHGCGRNQVHRCRLHRAAWYRDSDPPDQRRRMDHRCGRLRRRDLLPGFCHGNAPRDHQDH